MKIGISLTHIVLLPFIGCFPARSQTLVSSIFTDASPSDSNWSSDGNWSTAGFPSNGGGFLYEVEIPASLPNPVNLDTGSTINTLSVGSGSILRFGTGGQITLTEDLSVNNGSIIFNGLNSVQTRFFFNHADNESITLNGSGTLTLTGGLQNLRGTNGQLVINGPNHTIQGYAPNGSIGENSIDLQNEGTITANVSGETLRLSPRNTFSNTGTVSAINGGILSFLAGTYSGSDFLVGDGSEFTASAGLFRNLTFVADDQDADPSNNIIRNTGNMDLEQVTFEQGLTVTNNGGQSFDLFGDLTNNALIELTGSTSIGSRFSFNHPSDESITVGGTGSISLTGGSQNLRGANDQLVINGPNHTIQGYAPNGSIGENSIDLQNEGTITANVSGETLRLSPRNTFSNTGTVSATNGGILSFLSGTYSGSDFLVGDGSEFTASAGLFRNLTFSADDQDSDPSNNIIRNSGNMDLDQVTFEQGLTVTNNGGQSFDVLGDLTNNALIELTGTSSIGSRFSFAHPSGEPITLGGSGSISLTGGSQNFTGVSDQLLINGPNHTIRGFSSDLNRALGSRSIDIHNEGAIIADVPGETLAIVPRNAFINKGTLRATNGAHLDLTTSSVIYGGSGGLLDVTSGSTAEIDSTVSGFFQIGGEFRINGELEMGTFLNFTDGRLTGTGTISSDFSHELSSCVISPGTATDPIGTITLETGDNSVPVANKISGTLEIDLFSETHHDVFNQDPRGNAVNCSPRSYIRGGTIELVLSVTGPPTGFTGEPIRFITNVGTLCSPSNPSPNPGEVADYRTINDFRISNVNVGDRISTTDGLASFEFQGIDENEFAAMQGLFNFANDPDPSLMDMWLANPNFAPRWDAAPYSFSLASSPSAGTVVGSVAATDPENDAITYSMDPGAFRIDSSTGQISVMNASALADDISISVNVTAADNELSNTTSVTITIGAGSTLTNEQVVTNLLTGPGGPFQGETNPAIIAPDADPDGDGVGNIFELWTGTDPSNPNGGLRYTVFPLGSGATTRAALEISVDSAVDDLLTIDGFFGFDLAGLPRIGDRSVLADDGTVRTLRYLDTEFNPSGTAFARLMATFGAIAGQ